MSLLTEKAYTLLHAGPLTTQELAANLGIARSSVSEILRPLRQEGKVRVRWVKPGWKGQWGPNQGIAVYELVGRSDAPAEAR